MKKHDIPICYRLLKNKKEMNVILLGNIFFISKSGKCKKPYCLKKISLTGIRDILTKGWKLKKIPDNEIEILS